jgi:hypothetical protein
VIASFGSATTAAWCWPLLTGGLSDHFAREAARSGALTEAARAISLHQAMYVIPALSLALAATLWAGARATLPPPSHSD